MQKIDCFLPFLDTETTLKIVSKLREQPSISHIYLLVETENCILPDQVQTLHVDTLFSSATLMRMLQKATAPYFLFYTKKSLFTLGYYALERMLQIAQMTDAALLYANHYRDTTPHELIDYQIGSLRDDFDMGSLLLFDTKKSQKALQKIELDYQYAALYRLRLLLSQRHTIQHINEYLYTEMEWDRRASGEKLFDYVNPQHRMVQIEMEKACTRHLKEVGGYLKPDFESVDFSEKFQTEASVIIPVRNRERTISEAIVSVLSQKTDVDFNLIVVDNHSKDKTSEIVADFSQKDSRLIHIIPTRNDLGIGGCWNMAIHDPRCGKFAIQLDSDDLYAHENALQKIIDTFYQQNCAMVIGTYQMTDFHLQPIPPGIIDHREWTPDNGRNNALRINGLGAPRAFYTPILRTINLPNTSYGEDYAIGLCLSRTYRIGRIYEVLYTCRRWEDNSDAALDTATANRHNTYKDRLRTWELKARIALNQKQKLNL